MLRCLTPAGDAIVVPIRPKTLLADWNDVLGCLSDSLPISAESAMHRYLQQRGIFRLPKEAASDNRNTVA